MALQEIPRLEWPQLRDLYIPLNKYPSSYNTLQTLIDWAEQDPKLALKIFALDGDWRQDGTFVAVVEDSMVLFNTLSDDLGKLQRALNCLDLSKPQLFFGFREQALPAVEQHFLHAGYAKGDFKADGTYWYHISKEEARQFKTEPPEGITLGSLELKHAKRVHQVWPHGNDENLPFVEKLITLNDTVAAFDSEGNLLAWCLRLPLGSLGLLQVEAEHKRKGLGKLMVRCMAQKSLAKGFEVTAPVIFANVASQKMFESLGFKIIDKSYWAMRNAAEK